MIRETAKQHKKKLLFHYIIVIDAIAPVKTIIGLQAAMLSAVTSIISWSLLLEIPVNANADPNAKNKLGNSNNHKSTSPIIVTILNLIVFSVLRVVHFSYS